MISKPGQTITAPAGISVLLRDLIHERTGLYFEDERLDTMLDKLQDRARACNCSSYLDYYYILKYDEHGQAEWLRVMDAFSVQETYFYREFSQIRTLVEDLVPAWFEQSSRPFRIWSAACASGEEPYSISMALVEAGWGHHPIRIFASDASEAALDRATQAVYRERSFRSFPPALRQRYFSETPEGARLNRDLLLPVTFQRANLAIEEDVLPLASAEALFCRNVFIYFSQRAIERTVNYFGRTMPEGGHLFIGASESLLKLNTPFDLRDINGAFAYVRRPAVLAT